MNKRKMFLSLAVFLFILAAIIFSIQSCAKKRTEQSAPSPVPIEPAKSVTITAVGDCTLATDAYAAQIKSFEETAQENDYSYFFQNVRNIFAEDNLTIVNFEGTLSENGERLDKQFAFRGDPEYINILTSSSVEAANLANNHSSDYGDISHDDTEKNLDSAGIIAFGGDNIQLCEANGVTIALVGVNALNDERKSELEGLVQKAREMLNSNGRAESLVIVSIHWGEEKATEPNEEQIELAHKAIDAGANLVLGTHPHVLQGLEKYNGGYIAYSLGNFCFGGNDSPSDMDTIIYRQTFTFKDAVLQDDDNIEVIPCRISSDDDINNYQPIPAQGEEKERIQQKLNGYTAALGPLQFKYR